jgi:cystathionine gamma-synthase
MDEDKIHCSLETRVVHGSKGFDPVTGAVSFPIYQTATFRHPGLGATTGFTYTRQENPTRNELEETLALLENGVRGFAFSTGMAAIAATLDLLSAGDRVLYSEDLYGGTYRIAETLCARHGLSFALVDTRSAAAVEAAWTPDTRALFLETPSNPMSRISDIRSLSALARARGAIVIVDNTFLTPLLQRPLELGADIVVHSGTKFLAGHNDTLAGFAVTADEALGERLFQIQKTSGAVLAPFDSWLLLRGLKTLAVRIARQEENARVVSAWLAKRPEVLEVFYAGSPDHPQRALSLSQASGFGSMIAFRLRDKALVAPILERVRIITYAESLGGVESLITYPILQTHASTPPELRERLGVDDHLLRLSVGIESAADLVADLEGAFGRK